MSRGGRQKFGVDFIDQKAVHRAWMGLPLRETEEVWVMLGPASVKTIVGPPNDHKCPLAHDQELVGHYDMTIPLRDFMGDVAFAAEAMMRRSWRLVS